LIVEVHGDDREVATREPAGESGAALCGGAGHDRDVHGAGGHHAPTLAPDGAGCAGGTPGENPGLTRDGPGQARIWMLPSTSCTSCRRSASVAGQLITAPVVMSNRERVSVA